MSEATFEAATVQDALEEAAARLGVPADELEHEILEEKADFWGTGDSTVVIKAWARQTTVDEPPAEAPPSAEEAADDDAEEPDADDEAVAPSVETDGAAAAVAPEATDDAGEPGGFWSGSEAEDDEQPRDAAAEPVEGAGGEPSGDDDEALDEGAAAAKEPEVQRAPAAAAGDDAGPADPVDAEAIVKLLEQIFHDMEFDCTVEIEEQPDGFLATISGDDKDALLEGNGRCLSALELLANNAFRHRLPRGSKVRVDAGDFLTRRDEELSDLAFQVAHSAKESGRTQETQPLNPYERRLVHLALAEDSGVTTRSRGSGFLKNVQVIPKGGGNGGRRGRGRRG